MPHGLLCGRYRSHILFCSPFSILLLPGCPRVLLYNIIHIHVCLASIVLELSIKDLGVCPKLHYLTPKVM